MTKEQVERLLDNVLKDSQAMLSHISMPKEEEHVLSVILYGPLSATELNMIGELFGDDDIWITGENGTICLAIVPDWELDDDDEKS